MPFTAIPKPVVDALNKPVVAFPTVISGFAAVPAAVVAMMPLLVSEVSVPTLVNDDVTTVELSVVPLSVPAGATTAAVVIPVVNPFALIVTTGMAVELPVVPAVATDASVAADEPGPVAVTSPVSAVMPAAANAPVPMTPPGPDDVIAEPPPMASEVEVATPKVGVTKIGDVVAVSAPLPLRLAPNAVAMPVPKPETPVEIGICGMSAATRARKAGAAAEPVVGPAKTVFAL